MQIAALLAEHNDMTNIKRKNCSRIITLRFAWQLLQAIHWSKLSTTEAQACVNYYGLSATDWEIASQGKNSKL